MDVLPRQVSSHVKLAGISRPLHWLRGAEKPDLVAELDGVSPAREKLGATRAGLAVDLDRSRLEEK